MNQREEDRDIKRQPGQPMPGERGRESGGKPDLERERSGHRPNPGGGNVPTGGRGSAVE